MEQVTIQGTPVIDIYESLDGSYWFVTEKAWQQDSVVRGRVYQNDQIFFGYVRLSSCPECAEWGYFSEAELKSLGSRVWRVRPRDWLACPEVQVRRAADSRHQPAADSRDAALGSHSQDQKGGDEDEAAGI